MSSKSTPSICVASCRRWSSQLVPKCQQMLLAMGRRRVDQRGFVRGGGHVCSKNPPLTQAYASKHSSGNSTNTVG